MPVITVDWWGSDESQRRRAMAEITNIIAEVARCPTDAVTVIINDVGKTHWAKGGVPATEL